MSTLRLVVGVVVTLVWAAAWLTAIISSDYSGVGGLTPLMLLVVGYLFGADAVKVLRGNDKDKETMK